MERFNSSNPLAAVTQRKTKSLVREKRQERQERQKIITLLFLTFSRLSRSSRIKHFLLSVFICVHLWIMHFVFHYRSVGTKRYLPCNTEVLSTGAAGLDMFCTDALNSIPSAALCFV
ncbi:MAG: hypothetical protein PF589_03325, partial [Gammaproteobacteria bacterium]|nr:hypothetical protein [Gammaproteobacteria bacterium]